VSLYILDHSDWGTGLSEARGGSQTPHAQTSGPSTTSTPFHQAVVLPDFEEADMSTIDVVSSGAVPRVQPSRKHPYLEWSKEEKKWVPIQIRVVDPAVYRGGARPRERAPLQRSRSTSDASTRGGDEQAPLLSAPAERSASAGPKSARKVPLPAKGGSEGFKERLLATRAASQRLRKPNPKYKD